MRLKYARNEKLHETLSFTRQKVARGKVAGSEKLLARIVPTQNGLN